jgi:hypothetical protein
LHLFGSAVTGQTSEGNDVGIPVDLASDDALSPHLRSYVDQQKVLLYAEG